MFRNAFLQALREIRRNLMRSLLTAIGIVIGIASVITMVNIGKGASQTITQSVEKLGSSTLYIMPGQRRGPGSRGMVEKPFKKKDIEINRVETRHIWNQRFQRGSHQHSYNFLIWAL